jgi:hypothetical protein
MWHAGCNRRKQQHVGRRNKSLFFRLAGILLPPCFYTEGLRAATAWSQLGNGLLLTAGGSLDAGWVKPLRRSALRRYAGVVLPGGAAPLLYIMWL